MGKPTGADRLRICEDGREKLLLHDRQGSRTERARRFW